MASRNGEFFAALEAEIILWPGATWEYVEARRGHHPRVVLRAGEASLFVTISGSPGDFRANYKRMRDVRHTLAQLGLTKERRA